MISSAFEDITVAALIDTLISVGSLCSALALILFKFNKFKASFIASITSSLNEQLKEIQKVQIVQLTRTKGNLKEVSELYDEYKENGGNSYIDAVFNTYKARELVK